MGYEALNRVPQSGTSGPEQIMDGVHAGSCGGTAWGMRSPAGCRRGYGVPGPKPGKDGLHTGEGSRGGGRLVT